MKNLLLFSLLLPFQLFAQSWDYLGGTDISHDGVKLYSMALANDGTPYVFYNKLETDTDYAKFFVRKWKNNHWETLPSPSFDINYDYNCHNRIQVIDEQNIFVLFRQYRNNSNDVCSRVMKFNGNSWNYLGDSLFMPEFANTNLLIWQQKPILPFFENNNLCFYAFNGNNWDTIAHPIANTSGQTFLISSEVNENSIYFLLLNNEEYQVYSYENNTWSLNASIAHPTNDKICFEIGQIRINANKEVFVHLYLLNTDQSYVFKVANGLTNILGNGSLLNSPTGYSQMNLDKNGLPIIAFRDYLYYSELSVMHFDGNAWNFIGDRGFTTNKRSDALGLEIDNNNIPYVATLRRVMFDGYVNVLRLKQPIATKESSFTASFSAFPNPATDFTQINMPENHYINSIYIYDMNGKVMMQKLVENKSQYCLSIAELSIGTYLLQVKTTQGATMHQKLVKY